MNLYPHDGFLWPLWHSLGSLFITSEHLNMPNSLKFSKLHQVKVCQSIDCINDDDDRFFSIEQSLSSCGETTLLDDADKLRCSMLSLFTWYGTIWEHHHGSTHHWECCGDGTLPHAHRWAAKRAVAMENILTHHCLVYKKFMFQFYESLWDGLSPDIQIHRHTHTHTRFLCDVYKAYLTLRT